MTFNQEVDAILAHKGQSKGYDGGKGQLWLLCRDLPHPLGEIIYKVIRYHKQGKSEDLVKIAGWARLIWENNHADGTRSDTGDSTSQVDTRSTIQGPRQGRTDTVSGDFRSDTRGSGRNPFAEAVRAASISINEPESRISTGGRRSKFVGLKSGQRKVKG